MKSFPLISIAMCTYNGELFVREQLESLVKQDYPNLEIRIRDDMSTDKTWQIIQDFQEKYPSIHCVQNNSRLGFQKNFEKVFQDCQGIWIAPSDQDDIWSLDKISKLFSKTTDNIMVYHDSVLVDEHNKTLGMKMSDKFNFISGRPVFAFLLFNCISGHSMLFHKSLLAKAIPFPSVGFYDQWLAINAATMGKIENTKEVLVKYRQHANNQTDLEGKRKRITGFLRVQTRISRENKWLNACRPIFQNQKAEQFPKIISLAKSRESSYFSFGFGIEIWKNRDLYLPIISKGTLSDLAFATRYSWGLKLKKLFHVK